MDKALEFARACYASDSLNRFSPMIVGGAIVPSAYAADTQRGSLWEAVLRNIRHAGFKRVPTKDIHQRYVVQIRTTRDLKLLNLRRPSISNLVDRGKRPPDLTAAWPCAYDTTRAWAQALYDRIPDLDGFIYESHHVASDCVVIFQLGGPDIFETVGGARPLDEDPVRATLRKEARQAGAVVDFGDLSED